MTTYIPEVTSFFIIYEEKKKVILNIKEQLLLECKINKAQPLFPDVTRGIVSSEERSYVSQRCQKVRSSFGWLLAYTQLICCLLTQTG